MAMNEYSLADIAAVADGTNGNRSNGAWGGDGAWWIILLIALLGGFNGGFGGWGNGGYAGGNELYPWLNQAQLTTQGFADQNAVMALNGIQSSITSGFANAATQLCNCCSDMQMAVANGFANAETAANARQMANMQQGFGMQTAMLQGFNAIQAQQADCCCENRLGLANLNATILAENCADRAALSDGVRDIIAGQTAGIQRILDKLCDQELQAERRENDQLRQQLNMANLAASQIQQTAQLQASQVSTVDALYNRLATCPVGTMPVYGNQPIFTCNSSGCGCGNM